MVPNSFAQETSPESVVRVIYFLPKDRPPQPDMDTKLDILIKDVQQFYADEMERHGFGRKTFRLETDATGNTVVHHVKGTENFAFYKNGAFSRILYETRDRFDTSKNIYFFVADITNEPQDSSNTKLTPFVVRGPCASQC